VRFILNGQVTVGPAKFWRVDDIDAMNAPDYDPITFLGQPFALINMTYNTADQARELVAKWNREAVAA